MISAALRLAAHKLAEVLHAHGESDLAGEVRAALEGSDEHLRVYLVSNDLWGGPGSIADQAGMRGPRDDHSRAIEGALAELGEEQIRAEVTNIRTANWVHAFRSWQAKKI